MEIISINILFYILGAVSIYIVISLLKKDDAEIKERAFIKRLEEEKEINKKNTQKINELLNSINLINTSIKEYGEKNKEVLSKATPEDRAGAESTAQVVLKEWLLGGDE